MKDALKVLEGCWLLILIIFAAIALLLVGCVPIEEEQINQSQISQSEIEEKLTQPLQTYSTGGLLLDRNASENGAQAFILTDTETGLQYIVVTYSHSNGGGGVAIIPR